MSKQFTIELALSGGIGIVLALLGLIPKQNKFMWALMFFGIGATASQLMDLLHEAEGHSIWGAPHTCPGEVSHITHKQDDLIAIRREENAFVHLKATVPIFLDS